MTNHLGLDWLAERSRLCELGASGGIQEGRPLL